MQPIRAVRRSDDGNRRRDRRLDDVASVCSSRVCQINFFAKFTPILVARIYALYKDSQLIVALVSVILVAETGVNAWLLSNATGTVDVMLKGKIIANIFSLCSCTSFSGLHTL